MISLPRADMMTIIRRLGLTPGLQFCLDAGHEASLPAASTQWLDLSGNGLDFDRGTDGSAQSSDPTINGTPGGRSKAEYLSFDGGDTLQYETANTVWMDSLHKAGAKYTALMWWMAGVTGTGGLISTQQTDEIGWRISVNSGAGGGLDLNMKAQRTAATQIAAMDFFPVAEAPIGAWTFTGFSVDAVAALGTSRIDRTIEDFDATYTSPSASDAGRPMYLGSIGGSIGLRAGSRIAAVAMWDRALAKEQISAFYQATRGKFEA